MDIPIGLSLRLPRQADVLARALLRPNRGSSVFPSPVRAVLQATTYESACKVSRGACGKAISRQTFGILSKIREVDNLMTTDLQLRVGESHPELSFAALNQGRPVDGKKKTRQGRCERAELLGEAQRTDLAHLTVPAGAAPDDVFDARILAWTAQRKAGGRARRLPESEQRDARGLKMEISYERDYQPYAQRLLNLFASSSELRWSMVGRPCGQVCGSSHASNCRRRSRISSVESVCPARTAA